MIRKKILTIGVLLTLALSLAACRQETTSLKLTEVTPQERTYLDRLVVLERAKAVALNNRPLGNALLDSLAAAWGDSAAEKTAALAPRDPGRSEALHQLLEQLLAGEQDSLLQAPYPRRLTAPLGQ